MSPEELWERWHQLQTLLERRTEQRKGAQEKVASLTQEKKEKEASLALLNKVCPTLLDLSLRVEGSVGTSLEQAVTQTLRAVYGEDYSFSFSFQRKNRPEVELVVEDQSLRGSLLGKGGGVSDLVSESLRMALLLSSGLRPLLILDEKYKFLDDRLVPKVAQLLQGLSEDFGLQILLMSHHRGFLDFASKVFEVSLSNSGSKVEEVASSVLWMNGLVTSG